MKSTASNLNSKSKNFELKLNFKSVFNPKAICNLRMLTSSKLLSNSKHYKLKKVLVKQSYLLIFWFKFLAASSSGLVLLPSKGRLHSTKTKAPMAQKTFSQEQYKFLVHRYTSKRIAFKNNLLSNTSVLSLSESLFLLKSIKSQGFFFGTNMLFVSKITFFGLVKPSKHLLLS